jgi:hypothetical protein
LTTNIGRTVRLFLVDGSATGLITAEIMNWTGHALISSRSRIGEALKREEASRTGVYFLIGDDPEQPTKNKVYIGEGDIVSDRIKIHVSDDSKEFWTRACFITSKDTNLTKAHVRYLENRLVYLTRFADRANLANSNEPSKKALPESDIADMEFFLEQIQLILPVVGFDFLRPKPVRNTEPTTTAAEPTPVSTLELLLSSPKYGYTAKAVEVDGEITVLKGSRAVANKEFAHNQYGPLREQLIKDGRLKPVIGGPFLEFAEDVTFQSPSAAAAVINNRNTNGREAWTLKTTGQTLKEWQDAQIVRGV